MEEECGQSMEEEEVVRIAELATRKINLEDERDEGFKSAK